MPLSLQTGTANWPMFGFSLYRTDFNPYEQTLNPANVFRLTLDWYIGAGTQLHAYNATTGSLLWTAITNGVMQSASPAVANGIVYLAPDIGDGHLYAFNAKTGAKLWRASSGTSSSTDTSPMVAKGIVYESWGNTLYAFNAKTGTKLWTDALGNGTTSSPALATGVIYFGAQDGYLYALNATTGKKLWSVTIPYGNYVNTSLAVVNGVVYLDTGDIGLNQAPTLYAFNATTGKILWSNAHAVSSESSSTLLAVANGAVYVFAGDVYAYNAKTGAKLWNTTTGGIATEPSSSPSVANGVVYTGSYEKRVYAFDTTTGATLWSYTTGGSVFAVPIVVNGVLYAGSDDFSLYAFHLPS
ncbi:MAG: hypothetical protein NVS4B7_14290 [Ktedonobacteraceae bacterium]